MQIELKAFDTLFFRDGRPFTMGEDSTATGPFPPNPGVVFGALRASIATAEQISVEHIKSATAFLKIKDFYLTTHGEPYYPAPLDLVIPKDNDNDKYAIHLGLRKHDVGAASNGGEPPSWWLNIDQPAEQVQSKLISESELRRYLSINSRQTSSITDWQFDLLDVVDAFDVEYKLGIARAGFTRTVSDGNLYRIGMVRPWAKMHGISNRLNISVHLAGKEDREFSPIVRLGGEAKLAGLDINTNPSPNLPVPKEDAEYFKIYLKTPAFFANGYFPDLATHFKMNLKPIAWAVGKPVRIGGFDMEKNEPKEMRSAAPAGSVYYYHLPKGEHFKKVWDAAKDIGSLSDYRSEEGFGLYHFGQLPLEKLKDI